MCSSFRCPLQDKVLTIHSFHHFLPLNRKTLPPSNLQAQRMGTLSTELLKEVTVGISGPSDITTISNSCHLWHNNIWTIEARKNSLQILHIKKRVFNLREGSRAYALQNLMNEITNKPDENKSLLQMKLSHISELSFYIHYKDIQVQVLTGWKLTMKKNNEVFYLVQSFS